MLRKLWMWYWQWKADIYFDRWLKQDNRQEDVNNLHQYFDCIDMKFVFGNPYKKW